MFAEELGAHRLIKNRSIWRQFPTVRCNHWSDGNIVLLGDAVHTAHFSIGSGTKLAMEDSIALADALVDAPTGRAGIVEALANYERARRPVVESLQAAAQASLEWFEHTERYMKLSPEQFTYHLMTRSLRVSHASMAKRDPALVQALAKQVKPAAHLDIASGVRVTLAADDSAFDGVVAAATRALSNGARMIIVEGGTGDVARIGAAERIRFELGATVAITLDAGSRIDRDALIVAGRVDLVLP